MLTFRVANLLSSEGVYHIMAYDVMKKRLPPQVLKRRCRGVGGVVGGEGKRGNASAGERHGLEDEEDGGGEDGECKEAGAR